MPLLHPVMGLPIKTLTYSGNTADVVLFTAAGSPAYPLDLRVTISGVYLYASNTSSYGLDVGGFASGSKITITNNGAILGCGGVGGAGSNNGGNGQGANGTSGSAGGPAFRVQAMTNVITRVDNTSGAINGGGGGGGGGAGGAGDVGGGNWNTCSGGGGGGGYSFQSASGGAAGFASGGVYNDNVQASGAGGAGGSGSNGAGGQAGVSSFSAGGAGGAGGGAGAAGSDGAVNTGSLPTFTPGSGAAGGAAVVGNANITWIATGTRNGAIT